MLQGIFAFKRGIKERPQLEQLIYKVFTSVNQLSYLFLLFLHTFFPVNTQKIVTLSFMSKILGWPCCCFESTSVLSKCTLWPLCVLNMCDVGRGRDRAVNPSLVGQRSPSSLWGKHTDPIFYRVHRIDFRGPSTLLDLLWPKSK